MITKAVIQSINGAGNRCIVRMPLFETAGSTTHVEAEALINIPSGFFNNLFVGDIVLVGFEENALEKPIILGKLFRGVNYEKNAKGGMGILDTLKVHTTAYTPAATTYFEFSPIVQSTYENFKTPKKIADYILWLEKLTKKLINQLDGHFRCFKNWTQWQLKPENVEIDDGDIDDKDYKEPIYKQYQDEGATCIICGNNCTRDKKRNYLKVPTDKNYPSI